MKDNGTFGAQTTFPTEDSSESYCVAVGDFNRDGQLDLAVANRASDNIGVLLGYGNGTFGTQTTFSTGYHSSPTRIAVGDFNGDGHFDIVVASFVVNTVGVLIGYSNGSFGVHMIVSADNYSNPRSVAIGDFNGDNHSDITVANSDTSTVGVLLGYGNATFRPQETYRTGISTGPKSVAIGYLNGDRYLDIAVANSDANTVSVLLGHGNGTFGSPTAFSTRPNAYPASIVMEDFNGDDHMDIAVAFTNSNTVSVLTGNGNGTFGNQTTFPTGEPSSPGTITANDFNGDGRPDIVVLNYWGRSMGILLNTCER